MELGIFFYLGVIILAGLIFGRLVKLVKLPNVTGYLIAGLVIGPFVLKLVPENVVETLSIIPDMALGFIAFTIGSSFKTSYFKRVGFTPIVIALTEGLGATLVVTLALKVAGFDLQLALLLGAIASATAPAATIMVVKQYKAKGPLTETLLAVVALDDAVALIAFGFAVAITKMLSAASSSVWMSLLSPFYEVGVSLVVGAVLGFLFTIPLKFFKKDSNRICITVGFVFLGIALADLLGGSPLLLCMSMGAILCNVSKEADKIMDMTDYVTPPLFVMFFVVSGADLNLAILPTIGLVGVLYLFGRIAGKYLGAWLGATLMKAPPAVKKFLGPTLFPQAGVAIGLSLIAESVVPMYAATIRAVVLCATLIYEIFGAAIAKVALKAAGEIEKTA